MKINLNFPNFEFNWCKKKDIQKKKTFFFSKSIVFLTSSDSFFCLKDMKLVFEMNIDTKKKGEAFSKLHFPK